MSPSRWLKPFRRERDPSRLDLDDQSVFSAGARPSVGAKTLSHASSTGGAGPIFGSDIAASTQLAHGTVLISTEDGVQGGHGVHAVHAAQPLVYGNIPLVVVSCGSYLKKHALETEGIFRVGGSSKRLKALQDQFSHAPDYGSNVDWSGFTVHDAASLLRRYLTALPEPLVPLDLYDEFRRSLLEKPHLVRYLKDKEQKMAASIESNDKFVARVLSKEEKRLVLDERRALLEYYASLFDKIHPIQRRTLFYILDLLALFHLNSKANRMSAKNLSYVFQPSVIFHPDHELSPDEYALSGLVLEFCITYSYKILAKVQDQAAVSKLPITPTGPRPHSKSLSQMNDCNRVVESPKPLTVPRVQREQSISSITTGDLQRLSPRKASPTTPVPHRSREGSAPAPSPAPALSPAPAPMGAGGLPQIQVNESTDSFSIQSSRTDLPE